MWCDEMSMDVVFLWLNGVKNKNWEREDKKKKVQGGKEQTEEGKDPIEKEERMKHKNPIKDR